MKKIIICSGFIMLLSSTFLMVPYHHYNEPGKYVAGYFNMVTKLSYSAESNNNHVITLQCDSLPIAYYSPESYDSFSNPNSVQSYFLPYTQSMDLEFDGFYKEMQDRLKLLGILFNIDKLSGKFSGLRINFTTDSLLYDVTKYIDEDCNTVRFNIMPTNKM